MHFDSTTDQTKTADHSSGRSHNLLASNTEMQMFFKSNTTVREEPEFLDFGRIDLYEDSTPRPGKNELLIAWNKSEPHNDSARGITASATGNLPITWKIPGRDDGYKGWKPGDSFDSKDFEGFKESVRVYVTEFMKLNHIDKSTHEGEAFRNAFQHELAAAVIQKQTGLPVAAIDAIGLVQEIYQAGKGTIGISGGASMIEAGGRIGNEKLTAEGKRAIKENSDKLATMFPTDTPNDMANNHRGAELASGMNSWDELLKRVASSAAKSPTNNGVGQ